MPLEQVCVANGAVGAVATARPDAGVRRGAHLLDRPQGAVRRLDAAVQLDKLLWVVGVKAVLDQLVAQLLLEDGPALALDEVVAFHLKARAVRAAAVDRQVVLEHDAERLCHAANLCRLRLAKRIVLGLRHPLQGDARDVARSVDNLAPEAARLVVAHVGGVGAERDEQPERDRGQHDGLRRHVHRHLCKAVVRRQGGRSGEDEGEVRKQDALGRGRVAPRHKVPDVAPRVLVHAPLLVVEVLIACRLPAAGPALLLASFFHRDPLGDLRTPPGEEAQLRRRARPSARHERRSPCRGAPKHRPP
mmetsp:Transcript_26440/g.79006  ORF Transcript_26440/g.79006 Transcript_26440/m.79006 type:complete len:304 (-) Transcript_26440:14-925(-)